MKKYFPGVGWMLLLVFATVILFLVALAAYRKRLKKNISEKSAIDLLKEKYARGEIDQQEFDRQKKHLAD